MEVNKAHIRHCMMFMFNLGKTVMETRQWIWEAYGEDSVGLTTVKDWFAKFKRGEFNLDDKPRSGRLKETQDNDIKRLLEKDNTQSTRDIAKKLKINQSTVQRRLRAMGMILKATRWIPHDLSERNKSDRLKISLSLLARHRKKSFLWRIVTGDEKWVYFENPVRKRSWVNPGQPSTSTPKQEIHGKKVLLCMWWDIKGLLFYELLDPGETVTSERYSNQLIKLNDKIKELRSFSGHSERKIMLLHDNARPHIASYTKNTILELGWEVLPHPAYSPDLAPSDFHIFRSLQHTLANQFFKNRADVTECIDKFFASKEENFYFKGIHMLPEKWQKVINSDGDYFEN